MTTRSLSIEIVPESIGGILRHTNRHLRVPVNQRPYAWKEEHVQDLYQDWAATIAEGRPEYFLGSIVVVGTGDPVEVFDGQQRLATSMVLIAAIRDYFYNSGDTETASLIERESLFSKDRRTHEESPHFRLNAQDHEYFMKRVLRRPDDADRKATKKTGPRRESHRRIDTAAGLAASHVAGIVASLPASEKGIQLHKWLDFIDKGARVIWVQVADGSTAFTIFETMNDRGLKLSAADLLKNYMCAMAGDRENEAVQKWQSMAGILESIEGEENEIVDYVRYFWIADHGPTRTRDLYDEIKRTANNKTKVLSLASALETRSQDYAAILTSSYDIWASYGPGVKGRIETLRALGVSQVRPLLLAALHKFSKPEFAKLLHACTCWSVRCLLVGVPSGTLEGYYGRNALRISEGKIKTVVALTKDMIQVVPNDGRFRAVVSSANVANAQLARYYLRVLQLQADGEKEPQYVPSDGSTVTLEHILPTKPGSGWKHVRPEDAKANCNRLGNQVLLASSVNSKLGNIEYGHKKNALSQSPFSLTREAASFNKWGIEEIAKHQDRLAALAVRAWPLRVK